MKMPVKVAIKLAEMLTPDEYVGSVMESKTEYIMYLRYKDDDEWSDDGAYAVSKKTGRIREMGGEEAFMCKEPFVWKRDSYKAKGHALNERDNDQG